MEILYLHKTGQVMAVREDGFAWGRLEVRDGAGVPPFALLRRPKPPAGSLDTLMVKGASVKAVAPAREPEVKVPHGD